MASERPSLTMPGARRAPDAVHTPLLARRTISSSMAALLWAHTSTRTGGTSPSFSADAPAGSKALLLPAAAAAALAAAALLPLVLAAFLLGAFCCLAAAPALPLPPAPRPAPCWLLPSDAASSADSMPAMALVLPE
jgi:hypothetical protein